VRWGAASLRSLLRCLCGALRAWRCSRCSRRAPGSRLLAIPLGLPLPPHNSSAWIRWSAAFAVIVNLAAAIVSGYAIGYAAHRARAAAGSLPFYPRPFIAGMNLVLLAQDAFSFLVGWELMSLASWALVLSEHRSAENRRAALVYIVMASGGALTPLLAFGLLAGPQGGYSFEEIRRVSAPGVGPIVSACSRCWGAGSKAGLVPLHAWFAARAPGRAESRLRVDERGHDQGGGLWLRAAGVRPRRVPPAWWWSVPVLVIAGVTALIGVLYALMEHDLKRLSRITPSRTSASFFIGLGSPWRSKRTDWAPRRALAFAAAIFHVFNHSLFKSLLFIGFGRGAQCERRTRHGAPRRTHSSHAGDGRGVPRRMHRHLGTAALQRLRLRMAHVPGDSPEARSCRRQWVARLLVPAVGANACLFGCARRGMLRQAFGNDLSGGAPARCRPRAAARPTASRRIAMLLLALLCLLTGILPGFVLDSLGAVTQLAVGARLAPQSGAAWLRIVAHRHRPQRLQRAVRVRHDCARRRHHRLRGAPRGLARPATLSRLGLRFPGYEPATQYNRGKLRAAHTGACSAVVVFRAREQVTMPKPVIPRWRGCRCSFATRCGMHSTRPSSGSSRPRPSD